MASIPQRVTDRLVAGIKKFKPVLSAAHDNKENESNTVIIITDMLSEVFGYAKYSEITSEISIRGTFCDLATQIDKKIQTLIEAKAIHHDLNSGHITQAVSYASTKGVDWVVLTNGILWQIYKVIIDKSVDHEKVIEIDFLNLDHHDEEQLAQLFCLSKEGWLKSVLNDYYDQRQALSKYSIAAALSTDSVLSAIRKNLKMISPDTKITADQIQSVLEKDVIIADLLQGGKADEARKKITKASKKAERESAEKSASTPAEESPSPAPPPCPPSVVPAQQAPPPN